MLSSLSSTSETDQFLMPLRLHGASRAPACAFQTRCDQGRDQDPRPGVPALLLAAAIHNPQATRAKMAPQTDLKEVIDSEIKSVTESSSPDPIFADHDPQRVALPCAAPLC